MQDSNRGFRFHYSRRSASISEIGGEEVMVEIKHLGTDSARAEVLETISKMDKWKVMATPIRFSRSFPEEIREEWRRRFDSQGVELVRVGRHRLNLFRSSKTRMGWLFAQPRWLFGL